MAPVHSRSVSWGGDRTELLPPGHRVGDWVVTGPIGSGGWAIVYAGHAAPADPDGAPATGGGGGTVALKVMPTAGLAPRQARAVAEAARRELELGRGAGHPRLVRVLDSVTLSTPEHPSLDGAIVLVMERARYSLRDLLDTGVSEDEGGRLIAGICEGLAHLHRNGWVHADLKPENILVGEDGAVRLSDFGLATEVTGTHGYAPPTGTPDYLPPERWKAPLGERGVEIRPSADIWALGIVIHEVFASGASPFPGATPVARAAAVQEYAAGRALLRMDPAVPGFWRELVLDCLAPTHATRAAHTAESLLERITARERGTGRTRRTTGSRTARRLRRRIRTAFLTVTACAAAGAAVLAYPGREDASASTDPSGEPSARIRVFNAQRGCQDRTDRHPQCSLGLAIDPERAYTAENVVPTRVWHGDVLRADCQVPHGVPITDEEDLRSALWFRVRLPHTETPAWLPAVRTKDRPPLPRCPRSVPAG
ncbi:MULTISPECIES: serine/threonine-protein kinase [unclassified Streptomyces]|uniref:serine/threonine-protein kinase n=1 Tax=unclassified Streptomyces TaxID=2593676 RepID=UPI0007EDA1EA|nr:MULTISPECIES: serine/threonine-protein kinase [unclassified Streptomyces]MCP3765480.1 serine/threonine protein kinase [Streptomyces sp. MAR25Y5]OBQ48161.1 serine/threonine protein kinase [Streptomyces sp. H-KF8]